MTEKVKQAFIEYYEKRHGLLPNLDDELVMESLCDFEAGIEAFRRSEMSPHPHFSFEGSHEATSIFRDILTPEQIDEIEKCNAVSKDSRVTALIKHARAHIPLSG